MDADLQSLVLLANSFCLCLPGADVLLCTEQALVVLLVGADERREV